MSPLEQTQARRFQFLHKLYEITEGDCRSVIPMLDVGKAFSLNEEQTLRIVDYLVGEGLAEHRTLAGGISLKHHGLKEIERALSAPKEPTTYFPPVVNILNVRSMVGSQIQQGTHESKQSFEWIQPQIDSLREIVSLLKENLHKTTLSSQDLDDASAEVATVEAQFKSSKPKPGIIRESLQSVRVILEGAAGDVVASQLLLPIVQLLAAIGR